ENDAANRSRVGWIAHPVENDLDDRALTWSVSACFVNRCRCEAGGSARARKGRTFKDERRRGAKRCCDEGDTRVEHASDVGRTSGGLRPESAVPVSPGRKSKSAAPGGGPGGGK